MFYIINVGKSKNGFSECIGRLQIPEVCPDWKGIVRKSPSRKRRNDSERLPLQMMFTVTKYWETLTVFRKKIGRRICFQVTETFQVFNDISSDDLNHRTLLHFRSKNFTVK